MEISKSDRDAYLDLLYDMYDADLVDVALDTLGENELFDGAADLLFILTANKDMYLIPTSIVVQARTLTLTNDYDKYKVYL